MKDYVDASYLIWCFDSSSLGSEHGLEALFVAAGVACIRLLLLHLPISLPFVRWGGLSQGDIASTHTHAQKQTTSRLPDCLSPRPLNMS